MTIKQILKYECSGKAVNSENDILRVIESVQDDLRGLTRASLTIRESLKFIREGKYSISEDELYPQKHRPRLSPSDRRIVYEIDLSQAKGLLKSYMEKSGKGCQSCVHVKSPYSRPECNEELYCGLYENENDLDSSKSFMTLMVDEHYSDGCEDQKPCFRPLEEILS